MKFMIFFLRQISLYLLLFCILPLSSSLRAASFVPTMPEDLNYVDIYLHTVDVSNHVYDNFGHTAIRVKDRLSGEDLVYNWGIFEFDDPLSFSWSFYQGDVIYKLGIYPYRLAKRRYQFEGRKVWQDKLNLSLAQKKLLLEKLIWNAAPENREYRYHQYYDNCSTRPRDYIDFALNGQLEENFSKIQMEKTFRDYIHEAYQTNPPILLGLDIIVNSLSDKQINQWESMFHPHDLRERLMSFDAGQGDLLIDSEVIFDFPRPSPPSVDVFTFFSGFFGLFIVIIIFLLLQSQKSKEKADRYSALAYRLLGLIALPLYLFAGLLGIVLPLSWAISGHLDFHHNINMILFLPFDLLLLELAWKWLIRGKRVLMLGKRHKIYKTYLRFHLVAAIGLAISWAIGDLQQHLDNVILFVMPVYLAIFSLTMNFGIGEQSSES